MQAMPVQWLESVTNSTDMHLSKPQEVVPVAQTVKNLPSMQEIPGLGRSSGEGNGNPLQCSCLENRTGRGAWQTTVHGMAESDTAEWLTLPLQELVEDRGAWSVAVHGVARSWT